MTKTPRDEEYATFDVGSVAVTVGAENFSISVGGITYVLYRSTVNSIVDWYIDTPAIRAALKAKDEEILRLRAALMGNSVTRGTIHFYGPGE